mmetsp:Transcript_11457/g.34781  ORF Transcript_11457/g.34781 Transcript_11457/m.34781 type:complete len:262 (-) Transcript_11457:1521-2306(-)
MDNKQPRRLRAERSLHLHHHDLHGKVREMEAPVCVVVQRLRGPAPRRGETAPAHAAVHAQDVVCVQDDRAVRGARQQLVALGRVRAHVGGHEHPDAHDAVAVAPRVAGDGPESGGQRCGLRPRGQGDALRGEVHAHLAVRPRVHHGFISKRPDAARRVASEQVAFRLQRGHGDRVLVEEHAHVLLLHRRCAHHVRLGHVVCGQPHTVLTAQLNVSARKGYARRVVADRDEGAALSADQNVARGPTRAAIDEHVTAAEVGAR